MNRRTFLKLAGLGSVSFAAGCSPESPKHLYSLVQAPEDMVTGKATWYASTCRECPAGCGLIARNREGRVVKVEGNPLHPLNRGKLCMRGQAALQAVYNPDRLKTPLLKEKDGFLSIGFDRAQALLKTKVWEAARRGPERVRLMTEVVGEGQMEIFRSALKNWNSPPPVVFEPFAYEALKAANREVFGVDGLVSYRLDQADVLLAFGAEFLETWLSPVEYAWKFKAMHAARGPEKGFFFLVSPFQTLTGANADRWLACAPGTEAVVALGLVRQMLDIRRGQHLPPDLRDALLKATEAYPQESVLKLSGIPLAQYEQLVVRLAEARRPLVLGAGSGQSDANGLAANLAANLLNLLLDPELLLIDAASRHRVETASRRADVLDLLKVVSSGRTDVLILNNVNPVFSLPPESGAKAALETPELFVVSLSNFLDETSQRADLILPASLPLETWDDYSGWSSLVSTLQPAMGRITGAPHAGDLFLDVGFETRPAPDYKTYIAERLRKAGRIRNELEWVQALQQGGLFPPAGPAASAPPAARPQRLPRHLALPYQPPPAGLAFAAVPSVRLFDGRGANKPWLCEIPDPISRVAWQSPVILHPRTAAAKGLRTADVVRVTSPWGSLEAPVYAAEVVHPGQVLMAAGQGHTAYGRYAENLGANPLSLLPAAVEPNCGGPGCGLPDIQLEAAGRRVELAHTDGSRTQHGRAFILTTTPAELRKGPPPAKTGLTMDNFPLTLPLPEGYDPRRDFYPAHDHDHYRWAMVVDLDRCTGCGACAAACYAENNVGIVGEKRIAQGREMAWLEIVRYHDERRMERVMFLPMLCQHCDNAPCESVCPVYAPHHSSEGLNNQIYNRCIGTRFCSQNCPYKVRRFNWFDWEWPEPMHWQLNPDVTVRSKGVMEKCSFCVQRIKAARTNAKNENRPIREGEIVPACVQTCPTDALVFGNLMDRDSRVRRLCDDPRAYQAMGYLNTKPAVIYLKKVLHEV
ncbi:MAG: 4Fe-4S dicluster domain-containing protein [Desulfobacterales bacterium]|nr:4Fe-4S dicluster domain-containing protein [Desulfobacterales bacterium]